MSWPERLRAEKVSGFRRGMWLALPTGMKLKALLVASGVGVLNCAPKSTPVKVPCGNAGGPIFLDICGQCTDEQLQSSAVSKCCAFPQPDSTVAKCSGAETSGTHCCPEGEGAYDGPEAPTGPSGVSGPT